MVTRDRTKTCTRPGSNVPPSVPRQTWTMEHLNRSHPTTSDRTITFTPIYQTKRNTTNSPQPSLLPFSPLPYPPLIHLPLLPHYLEYLFLPLPVPYPTTPAPEETSPEPMPDPTPLTPAASAASQSLITS